MTYGEIIQLGRHRLMCGDATNPEDIARLIDGAKIDLVLTDPPYGMKAQHKNGCIGASKSHPMGEWMMRGRKKPHRSAKEYPQMQGDETSETARKHYELIKDYNATKIFWGGQYFADFLPVSGAWIFWHKKNNLQTFSDGELAWVSRGRRVKYYEQMWSGLLRAGRQDLELKQRVHPTQKPVELHARILEDFSKEGDTVLDCFGGSGTTLIACEITNRKCLMMEISPDYCDIIKTRWEKLSPLFNQGKAIKLTEETGT